LARILAVCDNKDILGSIKAMLETEGYDVALAYGADEAMEALEKDGVDLLLLDYYMQPVNGIRLLERIRKDRRYASTKTMFLTAAPKEDIGEGNLKRLKAGYMHKPFDIIEFRKAVKKMLGKAR